MTTIHEPIRVMRIIARLNIGGPSIHVSLLTAGLNDGDFESILVTGTVSEDEGDMSYLADKLGVPPVFVGSLQREISLGKDWAALRELIKLLRDYKPHVVHTHTAKAGMLGRMAALLTRCPVIVHTFHGHVFSGYFGWLKTSLFIWVERVMAWWSSRILTISAGLKDDLVSYRIAPARKIDIVPLGLRLTDFAEAANQPGGLRAELGCSPDVALVGIVGRLVPIKNHDLFLTAADRVRRTTPNVEFVIVGDGEEREHIEQAVNKLELTDCVHFLGWRQDLPMIYADLNAVVISSNNEGTPVSLIEAMAARVPVVATKVGGIPDLLDGGRLGKLVPAKDAEALAGAIIEVIQVEGGYSDMIDAAQETMLAEYGVQRLIDDLRNLYLTLLSEKNIRVAPTP